MISVIIRSKNEAHNLKILLDKLSDQSVETEIIIVDSESEDETESVCEEFGCNIIQASKPFSYGKALNEGIKKATCKYVSIMSAHCFPIDDFFLYHMRKNFDLYKDVAGVYAKQIPHKNTNALEYRNFIHIYGNDKIEQWRTPLFNNGANMIDREVWEQIKFDEKVIAQEDMLWARDTQAKGYCIIYEPDAIVEHLHDEGIIHTLNRYDKEYRALRDMEYLKW